MLVRLIRLISGSPAAEKINKLEQAQRNLATNASKNAESGQKLKSAVNEARQTQTKLRHCFEE